MTEYVTKKNEDGVWVAFPVEENLTLEEVVPVGRPEEPVRSVNPIRRTRTNERARRSRRPDPTPPAPRRALESCDMCEPPGCGKTRKYGKPVKCPACDGEGEILVIRYG